jgi:hypothetical protein
MQLLRSMTWCLWLWSERSDKYTSGLRLRRMGPLGKPGMGLVWAFGPWQGEIRTD